MLDERKVKLMTRMALYEEQQGREDLKVSATIEKTIPVCIRWRLFCG